MASLEYKITAIFSSPTLGTYFSILFSISLKEFLLAIYKKLYKSLNSIPHFSHNITVKMQEELKQLGLEHYEAKTLQVLLKEKLNLRELSKKAGVPFGKIYSVVKSLKEKEFVKETNSRPKLVYVENASEIIGRLLKEKQEKERRLNETLR